MDYHYADADYEDELAFDEGPAREPAPRRDYVHHLANPLLLTAQDALMFAATGVRSERLRVHATFPQEHLTWSMLRDMGVRDPIAGDVRHLIELSDAFTAYGDAYPHYPRLRYARRLYRAAARALVNKRFREDRAFPEITPLVAARLSASRQARQLYDRLFREEAPHATRMALPGCQVVLTKRAVAWLPSTSGWRVAPITWFLSVLSRLEAVSGAHRARLFLASHESRALSHDGIEHIRMWQRDVILRYGNDGYPVAKAPDAIGKCLATRVTGGEVPGRPSPLDQMSEKYRQKERELGATDSFLVDRLVEGLDIRTADAANDVSACIKFVGYPIVDPTTSGRKARLAGARPDQSDVVAVADTIRLFSHLILKNYLAKHMEWPPIRFDEARTRLRELHSEGVLAVSDHQYPLEDWDHAEIHDIGTFDYQLDPTDQLADKACCSGLTARDAHYAGAVDPDTRRLLTTVLDSPSLDVRSDVLAFAYGTMPADCYAADLTPKECEFKPAARMYTLLHPIPRRALSCIQSNVKSIFFPYLPYTSMAMTDAEVKHRLHEMTRARPGRRILRWESDMSEWNLRFKRLMGEAFGRKMDVMAGVVNHFGQSHSFFHSTEFMVNAQYARVPNMEQGPGRARESSDTMWYADDSGKEGIEQRFWTCITATMVYRVLYDEPYTFEILGQGDNQVLVVDMGGISDENIGPEIDRLTRKFDRYMRDVNHDAKPEEFIESLTMLTYSRLPYEEGRAVESTIKFGSKVDWTVDDLYPNLTDALGSIFASGVAAARHADDPVMAWALALSVADDLVEDTARFYLPFSHTDAAAASLLIQDDSCLALTVPACCGGYPIVPLQGFLYSGEPDPLTGALATLRMLASDVPEVAGLLVYLQGELPYSAAPNRRVLLSDPFTLPFASSRIPTAAVSDAARNYLLGVRNRDIAGVAALASETQDGLETALTSMTPFYPEIARDLIEISAVGRANIIAGKFTNTRTLRSRILTGQLLSEVEDLHRERTTRTALRLHDGGAMQGGLWDGPSHAVADRLRREKWGLSQDEAASLSVVSPLDSHIEDTLGSGVEFRRLDGFSSYLPGPRPPYLGSKTLERRSTSPYQIESVPGLAGLRKLVLSYTAGPRTERLHALYDQLARSRCGYGIDQLAVLLPNTVGGTPAHRYESLRGASGIRPLGVPTRSTWMAFSTDHIEGLSASNLDWPIAVQTFLSIACYASRVGTNPYGRLVLSTDGLTQLHNTPRDLILTAPPLRTLPSNPLIFIRDFVVTPLASVLPGTVRPVTGGEDDLCATVAGLVFVQAIAGVEGSYVGQLGIASAGVVDIAAAAALGGRTLLLGAGLAVHALVVWLLMARTADAEHRFYELPTTDAVARAVARQILPMVTAENVDMSRAAADDLWYPSGGSLQQAEVNLARSLSRIAAGLSGRGSWRATRLITFPQTWPSYPVGFGTRWRLAQLTYHAAAHGQTGIVGMCKRYGQRFRELVRPYGRTALVSGEYHVPVVNRLTEVLNALGAHLNALDFVAPLSLHRGDAVAVWRTIRPLGARIQLVAGTVRREHRDDGRSAEYLQERGSTALALRQHVRPGPARGRTPVDVTADRAGRVFGRRTTVAAVWFPVCALLRGQILVVGTGRGGIQSALAAHGLYSVGLDLAGTLPAQQELSRHRLVPEVGSRGAVFSELMATTSGDWFEVGEQALALHRPDGVVIDIEMAEVRVGLEVLSPIFASRFSGRVALRLIVTHGELEDCASVLAASRGITDVRVFPCARPPSDAIAAPVIIVLRTRMCPGLADRGPRIVLRATGSRQYPAPRSHAARFRAASAALTGGLISASSLDDLRLQVATRLHATQGGTTTADAYGLSMGRYQYFLDIIDAAPAGDALVTARYLIHAAGHIERRVYGPVVIQRQDRPLRYDLETFGMRFLSLLHNLQVPTDEYSAT